MIPCKSYLPKCRHSVYLASPEEVRTVRARYCSFCTPAVDNDVLLRRRLRKTKGGE